MRKILLALGIMALICTPAMAGVNANGAIIVHTNDAYTYSAGTRCTTPLARPATCQETITQTNRDATRSVLWFLWAFLPDATPRVTTVYFGMNMDMTCLDPTEFTWAWCSPTGVTPSQDVSAGWPGDGESATVGWPVAITQNLYPFMVIRAGVELCGPPSTAYICSSINHVGGYAAFVDDSNPPVTDNVNRFGCVRWYEPGYVNCPEIAIVRGACCYPSGLCVLLQQQECLPPGVYLGNDTVCEPQNPCPQPGACCDLVTGDCAYVLREACLPPRQFLGEGIACAPQNPCPQPGACCDLATGDCYFIQQADCIAPRVWYGGPCLPQNPCPEPPHTGACCFQDGTCRVITEAECTAAGGFLWVIDEDCVDDCPPVPTENTTWGKIKANYR
ncbi:MAG: hypothetical protein FJY88_07545 [Candidatus Eisenbacteria bacterium]|nr:hypothetical protein [Candidatus Eisenbacteria bacterium]